MIHRMRTHNRTENPRGMTFGVQLLLILNIGAFVLEYFLGVRLSHFCALRADWLSHGAFWQLLTYQFIHQGIGHLLANMLGLFFLGPETERALGTNRKLILIFLPFTPIKAWVFVLILGAYELLHTLGGPGGAVANSAHLAGGIAGYIYATAFGRPDIVRKLRRTFKAKEKAPVDQNEMNRILDKANAGGLHTLTRVERALLKRAGKK